jgi:hypothetical protein
MRAEPRRECLPLFRFLLTSLTGPSRCLSPQRPSRWAKLIGLYRWLARHPHFHLHFAPTGASWINLVERWFAALTDKQAAAGRASLRRTTSPFMVVLYRTRFPKHAKEISR